MSSLLHGNSHRSSSDRLLNNHLDAQKALSASLLNLLSHSHSSTSSLLAYVTSSPGVLPPVRRSVRHAAFEGPLSSALVDNPESHVHGSVNGEEEAPGWATYISSLEDFRKDLKQIHILEEEITRVKRDREILVTRLIKTTKSRPKKSDLTAMAGEYRAGSAMSSRSSVLSFSSQGSAATKEGRRTGKLADAQAELLGCEEHLRTLELRIEQERNHVMTRGLEERFRAMEAVGRMWVKQAHRGLDDLEKAHDLPANAFELDSNGSIAPSQSASQIGYEDQQHYRPPKGRGALNGHGSITGSIAEENEDSSDDEGNLVVHENRRAGSLTGGTNTNTNTNTITRSNAPNKPSPLGVPSVSAWDQFNKNNGANGRRAASDVGTRGYIPPSQRQSMRRANSDERARGPGSDGSSIQQQQRKKGFFGSIARFFKGPKRDGRSGRESPPYGSGSPGLGGSKGGWHTRTDSNIKRQSTIGSRRGRRSGNDSSSDEEQGNLVSVSNNRNSTFSVDNVGRVGAGSNGNIKRSSTLPVASGLIPQKPARSNSQSTITRTGAGGARPGSAMSGAKTPTQRPLSRASTVKSAGASVPAPLAAGGAGGISRSNTMKSTSTVKSTGTVKSKRASQQSGTLSKSALETRQAAEGRNIMNLVSPPATPEVPKAPKSHVTPQMELPKAPGTSIVRPESMAKPNTTTTTNSTNNDAPAIRRSNSTRKAASTRDNNNNNTDNDLPRSTTSLPPSRLLSPPLKSALRPTSPSPNLDNDDGPGARSTSPTPGSKAPSKPIEMFSISAPGPVQLPPAEVTGPKSFSFAGLGAPITTGGSKPVGTTTLTSSTTAPSAVGSVRAAGDQTAANTAGNAQSRAQPGIAPKPKPTKRTSYQSMTTDGESVYESAAENYDDDDQEDGDSPSAVAPRAAPAVLAAQPSHAHDDEGSSSEEEDESRYQVYENERSVQAGLNAGPPRVEKVNRYSRQFDDEEYANDEGGNYGYKGGAEQEHDGSDSDHTAKGRPGQSQNQSRSVDVRSIGGGSTVSKRKSVRMALPASPTTPLSSVRAPPAQTRGGLDYAAAGGRDSPEPEPSHSTSNTTTTNNNNDRGNTNYVGAGTGPSSAGAGANQSQRPPSAQWNSRIGHADISSDDEEDDGYNKARKGLSKNTGKWESLKAAATSGTTPKRKKSTKGSKSGSARG